MRAELTRQELTTQGQLAIFIGEAARKLGFSVESAEYAEHVMDLLKKLETATPLGRREQVFTQAGLGSLRELQVDRTQVQGGLVFWNPAGQPSRGGTLSPHTISLVITEFLRDPSAHHWIPVQECKIAKVPFGRSDFHFLEDTDFVPNSISVTARIFLEKTFTTSQTRI